MKSYQFILYQRVSNVNLLHDNKDNTSQFQSYCHELLRAWKIFSFIIGLSFLLYGAWAWDFSDWNWLNSLVMALLTYLLAPWTAMQLRSVWVRKNRFWQRNTFLALFFWILTVDTSYTISNHLMHYPVFHLANFPASSVLFFTCGFFWSYQSTLNNLIYDLTHIKEINIID
jgi:hypothetical protein